MKTETLLMQMRAEQREDHNELVAKVESLAATMIAHATSDIQALNGIDRRLAPIENTRKVLHWTLGILLTALVPVIADACIHISHYGKP